MILSRLPGAPRAGCSPGRTALRAGCPEKESRFEFFSDALPARKNELSGGTRLAGKADRGLRDGEGLRARRARMDASQRGLLARRFWRNRFSAPCWQGGFVATAKREACWQGTFDASEPRCLAGKELRMRSNAAALAARNFGGERTAEACQQGSPLVSARGGPCQQGGVLGEASDALDGKATTSTSHDFDDFICDRKTATCRSG